nr:isocitrate dehydrogenase=NADP-linked dimeric isocitrate dehydrogenase homolog {N-terminal} {EC 1.1.1.41} [Saccharolobus solfataricus]
QKIPEDGEVIKFENGLIVPKPIILYV